ncbi:YadA-like family protein [Mesorhizobium sp. CA14]|uniref:YadA-like family protein n=1 Tax=Mesorhizobium sp. CA14 TaxID=2876642 RepID=UPI001CCA5363|nr:YadA-like family protein [Mesorhizobium sp. CA14]MBZ9852029.1 YadA-like family protein [Mesorhizobium sp. CA14]
MGDSAMGVTMAHGFRSIEAWAGTAGESVARERLLPGCALTGLSLAAGFAAGMAALAPRERRTEFICMSTDGTGQGAQALTNSSCPLQVEDARCAVAPGQRDVDSVLGRGTVDLRSELGKGSAARKRGGFSFEGIMDSTWNLFGCHGGRGVGAPFLVLFFMSFFWTAPVSAQVSFGGDAGDPENTVCSFAGYIGTTMNDDCSGSDTSFVPAPFIQVGPTGSQINLDANTGEATFGAKATFNANVQVNGLIQADQATINQGTFGGSLSAASGATVNMNGNRIQNVGTPTAGTDAATKDYVDSLASVGVAKDAEQDGRLDGVEAKNVEQDGRLDGHDTMLAAHQATLDTHTLQIADLDSRVTTNTQDIANLDNRVTGLEANLSEGFARLDGRIDQAFEGAAMAMAAPAMPLDKNYAVSINWGGFEGKNAFAGTAQARISESFMVHGGIGVGSSGTVGGRAGLTYAW